MKTNLCQINDLKGLQALKPEDIKVITEMWKTIADGAGGAGGGSSASLELQGVLTDAEFKKVKDIKQEISKKTLAQLKDMCATNKLPKSGKFL